MLTIKLDRPILKAEIIESGRECLLEQQALLLEKQMEGFEQVFAALQSGLGQIEELRETLISKNRAQVARLAVEIAAKILAQKVSEGDYEIQNIITEALDSCPATENVTIYLNPQDFEQCRKIQTENPDCNFGTAVLKSDKNIGRAQCLVETPKGSIESTIESHLQNVLKALST